MSDYDDETSSHEAAVESRPASHHEADITDKEERERARAELEADVEAFLARGGKIQQVDINVMADPPKRPESNYGGQPI